MPSRIEDYAIVGDLQTCALIARDGSVDWFCAPRFDSYACFAALLGTNEHGRWIVAPAVPVRNVTRRYRGDSLILETEFEYDSDKVRLVDFMPIRSQVCDLVRIVEGIEGEVPMRMDLVIRFDYGSIVPDSSHTRRMIGSGDALRPGHPPSTKGETRRSTFAAGQPTSSGW